MSRIRVIGIGSAAGNDQLGWLLIEKLQQAGFEQRFAPGSVGLSICRFPAQLVQLLEGCDSAVILDAVQQEAGRIFEYSQQDLLFSQHLHSTHGIGVGEALALAGRLLPAPVAVKILGIGVGTELGALNVDADRLLPSLEARLMAEVQAVDGGAVIAERQFS